MICVFPSDATDFAGNGLCVLTPTACSVTETLNGEWELSMTHPLDERDKWTYLQVGSIIRAPVPAAMTPRVSLVSQTTGWSVYTITTKSGKLNLRSGPGTNYKRLGQYAKGKEVVLIGKTNDRWYEVTAPDGKRGYMSTDYLTFARTEGSSTTATGQVVEPRQVRDQPFRIYRVVPTLTQVEVYARHIFYDLMDNMILSYKPEGPVGGTTAAHAVLDRCESAHDFTMYTDLTGTAEGLAFEHVNPVEAMLGDEGIVGKYHAELARDWYDVYLVNRVGRDTDVEIRQGKNLLGISYDLDESGVVTRIVPTGEDKDGHVLYLPEKHIDSPNIGAYPHVKWGHLAVSDAKEDDDNSKSEVYRKLREAAQTELDNGCDLPTVTLDVDFLSVDDTEEYRDFGILHSIYLGDAVRVVVPRLGLTVALRMTQYTYDCLLRKYTSCTLGTALDGVEGSMISASQLAAGSIGGIKLAMGSIGTGHLQDGSVGSLQVRTAAIGSAHIQQAAIGEAHIQNAAITTAKIEDLAVTRGKIAEAAIGAAQIEDASITRAKIGEAAIGSAQIEEGIITSAHIGAGEIQEANIHDGAITHAKITDGAIRNAHIENGSIDSAKIADAAIQNAHIAGAAIDTANIRDGAIANAKIADAAVTRAKIADLAVGSAQIDDLAVTTAKIAQAAITNAQIANAAIDTAKIALGAITAALIEQGAVGTAQIADGSITDAKIVELTANKITAGQLSVERLIIRGSEQSIIYAINNMGELVSTQVDTIDGYVLTERTITADKIVAHSITTVALSGTLLTNLAAYFAAGNNTICIYNPSPVESSHGYSNNYLQWSSVTITVTYTEGVSVPTVSSSSVNLGSAVTISTNRLTDSAAHTLTYAFGSATGTIATNVGASVSWTPGLALAAQIPNATSGLCTITCKTFVGGTETGSSSVTLTLNVPSSVVPSITSVSTAEATSGIASQFGGYVRTRSKLTVGISASGAQGSTISAYRTTLDNVTYTASSFTSNTLNTAGTLTMSVTVTDSRGRTATTTKSITVLDYSPPSLTKFKAERCSSDGSAAQMDGTKVRVSLAGSVSSVGSKNTVSCAVYYKLTTSTSWVQATTVSASNYAVSASNLLLSATFDALKSYDLKVRLSDYFYYVEQAVSVGTKQVLMDFYKDGNGVAFGKVAESSGKVEFGWPLVLSTPLGVDQGGTGATTASNACAKLGAVKKSGDTMTGNLSISGYLYPSLYLLPTYNSTTNRTVFEGSYVGASSFASWQDSSGNNRRMLEVRNAAYEAGKDNALVLRDVVDGSYYTYRVFHAGMATPVPIANGGTGANSAANARANIGANNASNLTTGTVPAARLPFKVAYGSTSISGSSSVTINYSSAGFTSVPKVLVTYSTTSSNWSGDNGAIKVHSKTTTQASIVVGGSFNTSRNVDWLAIGT